MRVNDQLKHWAKIVGLIGAVLILVSLAMTWISFDFIEVSTGDIKSSTSSSVFDIITGSAPPVLLGVRKYIGNTYNFPLGLTQTVYAVLIGGFLALVGAVAILVFRLRKIGLLLPIGGVLALVGVVWAVRIEIPSTIEFAEILSGYMLPPETANAFLGHGITVSIIGAVLAIISIVGLKGGD